MGLRSPGLLIGHVQPELWLQPDQQAPSHVWPLQRQHLTATTLLERHLAQPSRGIAPS
ncbi:hypothetical protein ABH991_003770 [Bradyrhizobium ottawaense]|uniref:Uncharacterized protein n=1 Tax=Bradyrhizobium ottawaense TaxID=931866 RepID=A0ABV4G7X5_9BRAD